MADHQLKGMSKATVDQMVQKLYEKMILPRRLIEAHKKKLIMQEISEVATRANRIEKHNRDQAKIQIDGLSSV